MLETHILRSQIDKGSNILLLLGDVHAAACGLQSKWIVQEEAPHFLAGGYGVIADYPLR